MKSSLTGFIEIETDPVEYPSGQHAGRSKVYANMSEREDLLRPLSSEELQQTIWWVEKDIEDWCSHQAGLRSAAAHLENTKQAYAKTRDRLQRTPIIEDKSLKEKLITALDEIEHYEKTLEECIKKFQVYAQEVENRKVIWRRV